MVVASLWVDFVACVGWCLLLFWFTSFAGLLRDGLVAGCILSGLVCLL